MVKKKKCSYPKKIYEGQQFTLKGTLKANHKMQKVEASIIDARGKDTVAIKKKADSKKFDGKVSNEEFEIRENKSMSNKFLFPLMIFPPHLIKFS